MASRAPRELWAERLHAFVAATRGDAERAEERETPRPRHVVYRETATAALERDPASVCASRVSELRAALTFLDQHGFRRSSQQRRFHEAFLRAAIRSIYKEHYETFESRIKAEQGWDDIGRDVLVVTPRRFGKTFSVALFAAAYIVSVPGCEVGIFSTGARASKKLLDLIKKFVELLLQDDDAPWQTCAVESCNAERLVLRKGVTADYRTVHSYPAQSKVLHTSHPARATVRHCAPLPLLPLLPLPRTGIVCVSSNLFKLHILLH